MKFSITSRAALITLIAASLACQTILPNESLPPPSASATSTSEFSDATVATISIENADMLFYNVSGSTASEIVDSIHASRPTDPYHSNQAFDALTTWRITWTWSGYGQAECDLETAVVDYENEVEFPRWNPPADASPELIQSWNRYIENLALHEKGHVDKTVKYYQEVKTAIQNATCLTADAAAQQALEALNAENESYDLETDHGRTQGVQFP